VAEEPVAEEPVAEEPGTEPPRAEEPVFAEGRIRLFPGDDLAAPYIADPHRPTNGAVVQFQTSSTIDAASGVRSWLAAGGRFGVVRRVSRDGQGRAWQLGIEAGLDAQFDSERKLDNVGYDGNYGFTLTTKGQGPLVLKLAAFHTSAHVGDEWVVNTGRERIGYTREELSFGASGPVAGTARLYGEAAYAYKQLSPDVQRPWRLQAGIERESRRALAKGRLGWYAAADLQFWQERDFRLDLTLEAGLLAYSGARRWRLGARYSNGRVPLGEFFQDTESWLTLGLWVDF
jgi:hypothetical protein